MTQSSPPGKKFDGNMYRQWPRCDSLWIPSKAVALLIGVFLIPSGVTAYNRNVHLELTRFLAQSAGLSIVAAIAIANEDQRVDDNLITGPFLSVRSRRLYHFVDQRRLDELRSALFSSCSLDDAGFYFHALEDSYSHAGLGPVLGQGVDVSYDLTYINSANIEKAMRMAERKFSEFGELRKSCGQLQGSPIKTWNDIAPLVRTFVSSRKPAILP